MTFKVKITPPKQFTVTISDTEHGTVTADPALPAGGKADENKVITFTATPDKGYEVDTWTVTPDTALIANGKAGETTAKVKITADTTVKVTFKAKTTPPIEEVTITLTAGEHVNLSGTSFTVPKGSKWGTVLIKALPIISFDKGFESAGFRLDNETGQVIVGLKLTHELPFNENRTLYIGAQTTAEKVEGGVCLLLSPDKKTINIKIKTEDGSDVQVEGCGVTTSIPGDDPTQEQSLTATGTKIILKGKIVMLDCGDNQLTSLNVQGCTSLQGLNCNKNQLTSLNVQGLQALQNLFCNENQLTTLNVQDLQVLRLLICSDNQLTELNVQGYKVLQWLLCNENQLTSLNVQGCTALQRLTCRSNQLTELNVQGYTALQELDCYNNQITSLNVQDCTALQTLSCNRNQIPSLNVQGFTNLQYLFCDSNQLTSLDVQGLQALQMLICPFNKLSAEVFTKLFTDLPNTPGVCVLYSEIPDYPEGNCTDFTSPAAPTELKAAFEAAKTKGWTMKKLNVSGNLEEI